MPALPTAAFRAVGPDDAIPDGFVVPFYLSDRKLRISVARARPLNVYDVQVTHGRSVSGHDHIQRAT